MLADIASSMDTAASVQGVCSKFLNRMIGESAYSSQETSHLLLGLPLVRSSGSFQTIYLGKDGSMREIEADAGVPAGGEAAEERAATGESMLQRCAWYIPCAA